MNEQKARTRKSAIELAKSLLAMSNAKELHKGESVAASRRLRALMDKYKLSIEELEENTVKEFTFPWRFELHRKFIYSVLISVMDDDQRAGGVWFSPRPKLVHAELTMAENIEAREKLEFYWADFKSQLDFFYVGYIQKNKLVMSSDNNPPPELSPEDLEKMQRVIRLMPGIEKTSFRKALSMRK